jgi:hypothetical protein
MSQNPTGRTQSRHGPGVKALRVAKRQIGCEEPARGSARGAGTPAAAERRTAPMRTAPRLCVAVLHDRTLTGRHVAHAKRGGITPPRRARHPDCFDEDDLGCGETDAALADADGYPRTALTIRALRNVNTDSCPAAGIALSQILETRVLVSLARRLALDVLPLEVIWK